MKIHPRNTTLLMKKFSILSFLFLVFASPTVEAQLKIVATLPDCAAIAREIAGDTATVTCLASGSEDPHFVTPRPSYARVLNRADLLIDGGADLEIGWLPPLVSGARNRDILPGARGRHSASANIRLLGVPTGPVDRSQGHVHAAGNPHFLLDPLRGKVAAQRMAAAMKRLDAKNAGRYDERLKDFITRLDAKLIEWNEAMKPCKGAAIVTYHSNFDYFAERYGLKVVGQLEPKPGLPPTPSHVNRLVPSAKSAGTRLVLIGSFRPRRMADFLAGKTNAKTLALPVMPTPSGPAASYIGWIDQLVAEIKAGLK